MILNLLSRSFQMILNKIEDIFDEDLQNKLKETFENLGESLKEMGEELKEVVEEIDPN